MSEIEVGEYVRDIDRGEILQVEKVWKDDDRLGIKFKEYAGSNTFSKDDLKRFIHSKNIIDLIEVGDYINGERVTINKYGELFTGFIYAGGEIGRMLEPYATFIKEMEEDEIFEILTHEQYEQNCYKVGDIE